MLRKHIVQHIESNSILSLDHVDNILKTLNRGDEVDVIYLDYAKAFAKVDNNIILAKAKRYSITGKTLQWFTAFLKNPLQTVVVDGESRPSRL